MSIIALKDPIFFAIIQVNELTNRNASILFFFYFSDRLIRGQCPKGLRFNFNKMSCDYSNAVTCPNILK
jgi:hypothetical protein